MSLSTRHDVDRRGGLDFPDFTGEYFTVFPSYPKGRDLFDHITPHQLSETMARLLAD